MSWLSNLVGKIPVVGGAINSVAHNVVDPALRGVVSNLPGGSAALGIGDMVGRMIPSPGGAADGGTPGAAGAAGTAGAGGGLDMSAILKMLGLAGAGVAGVQGYNAAKAASTAQNTALDRNVGIAQAQADQGNAILKGAAPIRQAAESAMTNRLALGPPQPVNLSGFADTANPFRKKFGPTIPPPVGL
jgi:hypothetical protein